MKKNRGALLICLLCSINALAQLNVTTDSAALKMAQIVVGPGIVVSNAVLSGPYGEAGTFSGNNNTGLDSGIILTNGLATNAIGPDDTTVDMEWGSPGDTDLANFINEPFTSLWDACSLQFDFIAPTDSIVFSYVFGSEEYPDFVCSAFNDAFGLFISGPGITGKKNIALIPGTNLPVSINSINDGTGPGAGAQGNFCTGTMYPQYFVNNGATDNGSGLVFSPPNSTNPYYVQYNGLTTVLNASAGGLLPCHTYHLKLVISDVGDSVLDSGIFIKAGFGSTTNANSSSLGTPFTTNPAINEAVAGCLDGIIPVQLRYPALRDTVIYFTITGTAVNGTDYTRITDSVKFNVGDSVAYVTIHPIDSGFAGTKTVVLTTTSSCGFPDSVQLLITGQFGVVVTPHNSSICPGGTANLAATGGINYTWTPATGLSANNIANPVAAPLVTTTYQCSSTVGACTSSDTCRVNVVPTFSITVTPHDTAICPGQSVNLLASNGANYVWTPVTGLSGSTIANPVASPAITTTYTCTSGSAGCTASDTVRITVASSSLLTVTPHDTTLCSASAVQLLATGGVNYNWTPSTGLSNDSIANPVAHPAATTTYTCTSSVGTCTSSDTAHITVIPSLNVVVTPHDTTVCPGEPVSLQATGGLNYLWRPSTGLSDSTQANTTASPKTTTLYTCTSGAGSCVSSATALISVLPSLNLAITPHDTLICKGKETILLNAGNFKSYLWQDGSAAQYFTVTQSGLYQVTVTDANDCKASDSIAISEYCLPGANYFIPNIFTPNGDGNNDNIYVEMQAGVTLLSFEIFDRWGEKVHDGLYPWDGRYKDKPAPEGVYVYLVKLQVNTSDLAIERRGSIVLMR